MAKRGNKTGKGGFKDNPQNINKNGRPIAGQSFAELLAELMDGEIVEGKDKQNKINAKRLFVKAMFKHAINGSVGHMNRILDQMEGKLPIPIKELSDDVIDLNDLRSTLLDIQDEE